MFRKTMLLLLCVPVLTACSDGVQGVVIDGDSYRPVPHTTLTMESSGWGLRDGVFVWDAMKLERAGSDSAGRFRFKGDGGTGITVEGPNYEAVKSSLCPRSAPVFIGGPYTGVAATDVLLFPLSGTDITSQVAAELGGKLVSSAIGVQANGPALRDGRGKLTIKAADGRQLVFVSGTGNIPAAPREGWTRQLSLDIPRDCGWAFIAESGSAIGVIKVGPPGYAQTAEGAEAATLQFAPLP